jgi:hypothetical protein
VSADGMPREVYFHGERTEDMGPIALYAPEGAVVGRVPVGGSGAWGPTTCVAKLGYLIGSWRASPEQLRDLLLRPSVYRGEWDNGAVRRPARFVDSGCRNTHGP